LPVLFAILCVGWGLTYLITGVGLRLAQPMKPWAQEVLMAPFLLLYFILPLAGWVAAVSVTIYAATYLAAFADRLGGWTGFAAVSISAVISASAILAFYKWWSRLAARQCREGGGDAQQ
jgi:cobalamin synthase